MRGFYGRSSPLFELFTIPKSFCTLETKTDQRVSGFLVLAGKEGGKRGNHDAQKEC